MPELLAPLIDDKDVAARESLAVAYASEGAACPALEERAALLRQAEREFTAVVAARDRVGATSDADRLAAARARVAWGSTILRYSLAPELDRYEISGGLSVERDPLRARLAEAAALLSRGEAELSVLSQAVENDEEKFLLLGLAETIRSLYAECTLHFGWTLVWRATLESQGGAGGIEPASEALRRFDAMARRATEDGQRHSAAIGTGVALRLLGRADESLAVLDRLINENPPYDVNVRAHCEKGRTLLAAGRFDEARATLGRLAAVDPARLAPEHAAARFYVLLAPVLIGDAWLLEAESRARAGGDASAARSRGIDAMAEIAARGGLWPAVADAYLTARGIQRDPAQRSPTELAVAAQKLMRDSRFDEAVPLWRAVVEKTADAAQRGEARYNLGVCLHQAGRAREAGEAFYEAARTIDDADLSLKAAEFAYRCTAQAARETQSSDDYVRLADACLFLLRKQPKHPEAENLAWIAPVALQEAHRYADARAAYQRIGSDAPRYWEARRNALICRQAELALAQTVSTAPAGAATRDTTATGLAALGEEWRQLAVALSDAARRGDARATSAAVLDADLTAAELLSSDAVVRYREALAQLASIEARGAVAGAERGRMLAVRIRCYRGLGQFEQAAGVLDEYLRTVPADQVGEQLIGLAAGMESEIERLTQLNRPAEAQRVAETAVPTLRELLNWIAQQPDRKAEVPTVRFGLIKALDRAGRPEEALSEMDKLLAESPDNGAYIRQAALLYEQAGRAASGGERGERLRRAEDLWARLLADSGLRARAPQVYWEARYCWLRLRLEGGDAAEVARGIESERAWYPDLGGPPWQARLNELAEQARRQAGRAP